MGELGPVNQTDRRGKAQYEAQGPLGSVDPIHNKEVAPKLHYIGPNHWLGTGNWCNPPQWVL